MLVIDELTKEYKGPPAVRALVGLSISVHAGEIFTILGPNGAGKSTTINVCTTRLNPTSGSVSIAGLDVVRDRAHVRSVIGVVTQQGSLDLACSVRDNLYFHCRYHGWSHQRAADRSSELLEQFQLSEKRDARPRTLSGGLSRRLQLARAISHDPEVLFLDEPTTGLDPQSRLAVWDLVRSVRASGRTVVLTTHNLEEAETLSDRIAIIDHGELLRCDSPRALRDRVAADTQVELTVAGDRSAAVATFEALPGVTSVSTSDSRVVVLGRAETGFIGATLTKAADYGVSDVSIERPTLETAFLALTGRETRE